MRIRSWKLHPDFPLGEHSLFRGCWEYELQQGEATDTHQHQAGDEINIALEGHGRITIGNSTREIHAGEMVFVPAGMDHRLENPGSPCLRGILVEAGAPLVGVDLTPQPRSVTAGDIEAVVESIPEELSESEALQLIIRLFDLAGHLSEQIEDAIGLENETGFEALQRLEKRVMAAVVTISQNYENGNLFRRRF